MKLSKVTVLATIIIGSSLILAITSFWNDSLIVDEIPHVGSGYSYVKRFDYRLNPEHPPLAKALAAAPLLFLDLKQDAFETKFWHENINGQWDFGRSLIFQSQNNADLITRVLKFPMLLFFILAAVLIYKWTQKLYGRLTALTALTLFSFSPTVLAHSRFVTTDLPALFGVVFAIYFFIKYLENPNRKNLWLSGIIFGVAMLTKFSAFLLIPYFLILALIFGLTKKSEKTSTYYLLLITLLIFAIGFILIVWPVYYLFTFNYPPERQLADTQFLIGSYGNETLKGTIQWMADKPAIRALGQYALGLLMVAQRSSGGNTTYFLGEVSNVGWRYYFPAVYALKEPLPWFILVIAALLFLAWQFKRDTNLRMHANDTNKYSRNSNGIRIFRIALDWVRNHFTEFAMLLWLAIYWGTSIKSNLNIGVRHLLPTYPFAIILVSGQVVKLYQKLKIKNQNYPSSRTLRVHYGAGKSKFKIFNFNMSFLFFIFAFLFLMAWYIFENLRIWPYYLTYFNQLAGGPTKGYRYVVDSNLDWGQDLKRLSKWAEENKINEIHLDYFGWSDPVYYLGHKFKWLTAGQYKNAQDFLSRTGGGYLAVSGTFYMNSRQNPKTSYAWLDQFKPIAVIGNSIWVWELR